MKNRMFFLIFIMLLAGILIGLFLGNKIFNKRNEISYRNEIKGENNTLSQKNLLKNNNETNTGVFNTGIVTDVTGFNIKNYLEKKEKEWKQLWDMSDQQLYDLLKNDIKFEQKYKIDDLCNYLFYGKDDYKLKKCLGMSYNFVRRLIYILSVRLLSLGYGDPEDVKFYKSSIEKRREIFESRYKESQKIDDRGFLCIYDAVKNNKYNNDCFNIFSGSVDFNDSVLFFKFLLGFSLNRNEKGVLERLDNVFSNFLVSMSKEEVELILTKRCYKDKNYEDCLKKEYFEIIRNFLKSLSNLIHK